MLVNKHEIIERVRRSMEAVTKRLKRLPVESAQQCNEQDPHRALAVLERAVNEVMETARRALLDLEPADR